MKIVEGLVLVSVLGVLAGCSHATRPPVEDDAGSIADASIADASLDAMTPDGDSGPGDDKLADGTDPFDPEVDYAGEGEACRLSLDCGLRQICVDDACIRHERVDEASLEFGAWRRLGVEEWNQSTLNGHPGQADWSVFDTRPVDRRQHALIGPTSWLYPGLDGPQLVVTIWNATTCQVLIVGPRIRVLRAWGLMCSAAAVAPDGRVAIAGARTTNGANEIALFDRDDNLVWQRSVPRALHDRVAHPENWGTGAQVGLISSLYFWGDGLVATAARGTNVITTDLFRTNTRFDWNGMVFLDVTMAGEMSVRPVAGVDVVDGWKGWLADQNGTLVALVNRRTGIPVANPYADAEIAVLDLSTGEREQLVEQWAYDGHLYQPRMGYWMYQAINVPPCGFHLFDSDGGAREVLYLANPSNCSYPVDNDLSYGRGRVLETPWSLYPSTLR